MKKKSIFLFVLAIVLILATSISGALAYFTTYAVAKGGYTVHLGGGTNIEERFFDWTKRVTISNDPEGQPVYVRAKAFAGSQYDLVYSGENWFYADNGYYYYEKILYGGENTSELLIGIQNVPTGDSLEDAAMLPHGIHFNVVVVYETIPVQYDENGNPYADWSLVIRGNE